MNSFLTTQTKSQQIFTCAVNGRKSSAAFTLVELLIVLSIIGVLSSVVIGSTTASRTKARDMRRVGDLKEIQLALAIYYDVNRVYPNSLTPIVTDSYLSVIPVDPDVTKSYEYQLNGTKYCLGANLEGTAPTDIADADCAIPSSGSGVTNDTWFKAMP
jgi:prepilin-type N-terminal cleavage/methylation domain-containing protein